MKGNIPVSPIIVLNRLIDDFSKFESAGFLLDLPEFLALGPEKRTEIRSRAAELAKRIERFETWLEATKMLAEIPVVNLPADKLEHFDARVRTALRTLSYLADDNPEGLHEVQLDLDELFGDVQGLGVESDSMPDSLKIAALRILSYLDVDVSDADEQYFSVEFDRDDVDPDALVQLRKCLKSKYFQPSRWIARAANAKIVTSRRLPEQFPMRIRGRIRAAFDSYVVGHYFASIAGCRSLLEFVLMDRASPAFKFEPYVEHNGKQRAMELYDLIESASAECPELKDDLHFIRDIGRDVLHPPRGREVDQFPPQEGTARKVLAIVCRLISRLYA